MNMRSLGKLADYIMEMESSEDAKYDGILKKGYSFDVSGQNGQNGNACAVCFLEDTIRDLKVRLRGVKKCDCESCLKRRECSY